MPAKNDVFFSAASCKKGIIFGRHLFSFLALLISLGLYILSLKIVLKMLMCKYENCCHFVKLLSCAKMSWKCDLAQMNQCKSCKPRYLLPILNNASSRVCVRPSTLSVNSQRGPDFLHVKSQ